MTEKELAAALKAGGIENAAWEARLLRESLEGEALEKALARRLGGYPLQYLLGKWDFYKETYEVSEHCLIPRSDTEILVEKAVALLPAGARFADLCTGSGCIAVSTLCARPDTTAVAVDLFPETLALAARNAERNGVGERVRFCREDVLLPPADREERFDAILSNPPYIQSEVVPTLQREVGHEPAAALDGGADGLDFYRAILAHRRQLLKEEGFFLLEIGYDQGEALTALGEAYGLQATVFKDYGGNDRVVLLKKGE